MNALLILATGLGAAQTKEPTPLERIEREVTAVIEKVRPSVVQVTASFGIDPNLPAQSLTFSGVVYTRDGYVVTDAGGVDRAVEVRVKKGDRSFAARLVASDRKSGVAVLKVEAADLSPAALSDRPARPGGFAIAVGNAYGAAGSASFGTVNGVDRAVVVGGRTFDDMIQLTTPVQPGDCGGLVADASGRMVGLVHSISSGEGRGLSLLEFFGKDARDLQPTTPVSFATPAAAVKFAADRIIKHQKMVRGRLGVTARPLDETARAQLGLEHGAEIVRVEPDSPARRARLATRDILLEFDGQPVRDLAALQRKVAEVERPTAVKLAILRNGERREVEVEIDIDPQR